MSNNEKEFEKINIDKAKNKTIIPILLMVISILTYIIYIISGEFDFGIIFEAISLILLIVARNYMLKYDGKRAKMLIIFSIISIGLILAYDTMLLFSAFIDGVGLEFLFYNYAFGEIITILYIIVLFSIYRDLSKMNNNMYKESKKWFYEMNEEKNNNLEIRKLIV